MKFECAHADTCLSDYWSGHHLPHVCIPAYPMSLEELKSALHSEVSQGAFAGSQDWKITESEEFLNACSAAIDEVTLTKPIVFADIECDEDGESVYAYFVFVAVD